MKHRQTDKPAIAAAKASISTASAYRLEKDSRLPSQKKGARGQHRPDPLADIFDSDVVPMLKAAPGLRALAVIEEMMPRHPKLGLASGAPFSAIWTPAKTLSFGVDI